MATIYAGTGTINTSGAAAKTAIRAFSEGELSAAQALAANVRVFKFADAVAKKGDGAREHVGMIAEQVFDILTAHGVDPFRLGMCCRDPAVKSVTKTRTVRRPKKQTVMLRREQIAVEDGVAVLTAIDETREEPVLQSTPLVDGDGAPIVDPETGMHCIHFAPVMEEVEETYEEIEPDLDESGAQKWVLGLRYDELAQFVMAGLAARLAALEAH